MKLWPLMVESGKRLRAAKVRQIPKICAEIAPPGYRLSVEPDRRIAHLYGPADMASGLPQRPEIGVGHQVDGTVGDGMAKIASWCYDWSALGAASQLIDDATRWVGVDLPDPVPDALIVPDAARCAAVAQMLRDAGVSWMECGDREVFLDYAALVPLADGQWAVLYRGGSGSFNLVAIALTDEEAAMAAMPPD